MSGHERWMMLESLRTLQQIAQDNAEDPPPYWPQEDLHALGVFAAMFHARLLAAAPADVQNEYHAEVQRTEKDLTLSDAARETLKKQTGQ